MEKAKNKIRECVEQYIKIFADEYRMFKEQPNQEAMSAKMDCVETKVAEYPENLYMLLVKSLDDEDMKGFGTKEGVHWFVKSFPVFGVKYVSSICK